MIRMTGLTKLSLLQLLIVIILIAATAPPVVGYNDYEYYDAVNDTHFKQLILNIYIDEAGKALMTGYVEHEDIDSFAFLKTSEYLYENDTNQLYALTNSLTWKNGDQWGIKFTTSGYYADYHTVFYLPGDVRLFPDKINCSEGLEYFVIASNESFVINVQGYDVGSPMTTIEYQQPLKETGDEGIGFRFGFGYLLLVIALSVLALLLIIIIVKMKREKGSRSLEEVAKAKVKKGEIEVTSEMARVMETLTDRERAIVNALIKHNGEMTQADLRYETEIPKSSLTGILRTLERRRIINKKEWGRTNVIELSEWFLRKKGEK
jgi:uncharacterized membrane protein